MPPVEYDFHELTLPSQPLLTEGSREESRMKFDAAYASALEYARTQILAASTPEESIVALELVLAITNIERATFPGGSVALIHVINSGTDALKRLNQDIH